jgi:hypothetical protein
LPSNLPRTGDWGSSRRDGSRTAIVELSPLRRVGASRGRPSLRVDRRTRTARFIAPHGDLLIAAFASDAGNAPVVAAPRGPFFKRNRWFCRSRSNLGDKGRQHVGKFRVGHKSGRLDEDAPVVQKQFAPVGWRCYASKPLANLSIIAIAVENLENVAFDVVDSVGVSFDVVD